MNIVDIAKMKKLAGGGAAVVVDKLPEKDIKPNTIYAVKKYDYYTSIYGYKLPLITDMNTVDKKAIEKKMIANGWTEEEIEVFEFLLLTAFIPISLSDNGLFFKK